MESNSSFQLAAKAMEVVLTGSDSSHWINQLAEKINDLLIHDFNKLISLLYRVDINEAKLKNLLKKNPGEDAGKIIAELIIERQLQKIKSRKQIKPRDENSDDEKW